MTSAEPMIGGVWVERSEWIRLTSLERRLAAILSYYTAEDLAAHLAAAVDGEPIYSEDGVVRKVWVNHKLAGLFQELREEMGIK